MFEMLCRNSKETNQTNIIMTKFEINEQNKTIGTQKEKNANQIKCPVPDHGTCFETAPLSFATWVKDIHSKYTEHENVCFIVYIYSFFIISKNSFMLLFMDQWYTRADLNHAALILYNVIICFKRKIERYSTDRMRSSVCIIYIIKWTS